MTSTASRQERLQSLVIRYQSQVSADGQERPVAFASRALTPAERKYSASEREALACIWACEKWNFYLYGRKFTLVTVL